MSLPLADRVRLYFAISVPLMDGLLEEPELGRLEAAAADLEDFAAPNLVLESSIGDGSLGPTSDQRINLPLERAIDVMVGLDIAGLAEFGVVHVEGLMADEDLYTPAVENLLADFFSVVDGMGVEIIAI